MALMVAGEDYLKRVLDTVSWLADPDGFQHTCVPQLSENQAVIETQRQLSETGQQIKKVNKKTKVESQSVSRKGSCI